MPTILIDASCLMKELTGVGVYTHNLVECLFALESDQDFILFFNALKGKLPDLAKKHANQAKIIRRYIPGKILLEWWERFKFPVIENLAHMQNVDIFHSPNYLYQPSKSKHIVTTVHDLSFLKKTNYGSRYSGAYHRKTLRKNLKHVSRVVVPTESVKADLIRMCELDPDLISVIHFGIQNSFLEKFDLEKTKNRLINKGYPQKFILSVGTIEPRKNLPILVEAFSSIENQIKDTYLIIAGGFADGIQEVKQKILQKNLEERVLLTNYISAELLRDLYRCSLFAVFPSWEEGFGFPPLEALACGVPVIVSDISTHREVLGDAAVYFDVNSSFELSRELLSFYFDEGRREKYVAKGEIAVQKYSWRKVAEKHLEVYNSLVR